MLRLGNNSADAADITVELTAHSFTLCTSENKLEKFIKLIKFYTNYHLSCVLCFSPLSEQTIVTKTTYFTAQQHAAYPLSAAKSSKM